ncbi:MAG: peptidylprolyl isomerase [Spirulinaceae cyanobacterium]
MTQVLRIGDRAVTSEAILPLLAQYQLIPALARELIIEDAIASIELTPIELTQALEETTSEAEKYSPKQQSQRLRQLKLHKFKEQTWGHQIESEFLKQKSKLDKVVYSLLRTKDAGAAQEFYCRLLEQEVEFADLARQYSQGPEAKTGGLIGPVSLQVPHPNLARLLAVSDPGELWPPTTINDWYLIVRLEQKFPAQLDAQTREKLLQEKFDQWLQQQLAKVSLSPDAAETLTTSPS